MKKALSLLILIFLVCTGSAATMGSQTSLDVYTLVNNCMALSEKPSESTLENQTLMVEFFNWNCGNVGFNGTATIELWDSNTMLRSKNQTISLEPDEYSSLDANWSVNTTGEYEIRAYTTYEGEVLNSTVEKNSSINYSFAVEKFQAPATPNGSTSSEGPGFTGGFGGIPELSFSESSRAVQVYAGSNLFIQPEIVNTGTAGAHNLTVTVEAPWTSSRGYVKFLGANSSIARGVSVEVPDSALGLHLLKARLVHRGEVRDTMLYLVKVEESPSGTPVLRIVSFTQQVTVERGERFSVNYTLENAGDGPSSTVNTYFQNAGDCIDPVETRFSAIPPGERLNARLVLEAGDAVAVCNASLIATTPSSTDAVNMVFRVQDTQNFPFNRQSFANIRDALTKGNRAWITIVLLVGINLYLITRTIKARKEEEDEEYRCKDCGKTFDSAQGLKIHRGMVHKDA